MADDAFFNALAEELGGQPDVWIHTEEVRQAVWTVPDTMSFLHRIELHRDRQEEGDWTTTAFAFMPFHFVSSHVSQIRNWATPFPWMAVRVDEHAVRLSFASIPELLTRVLIALKLDEHVILLENAVRMYEGMEQKLANNGQSYIPALREQVKQRSNGRRIVLGSEGKSMRHARRLQDPWNHRHRCDNNQGGY